MRGRCGVTDDDLGRLLSLVSHEVRGPLGVMRGYLRLLEQRGQGLDEMQRRAITAALGAGDRAAALLDDLSGLARLCRREAMPPPRSVLLEPLLSAAAAAVPVPNDQNVTMSVLPAPDLRVLGDEALLRQALAGLLTAVVRSQIRSGTLVVRAREERRDRAGVTVTIDNGEHDAALQREEIDVFRGGFGLALPIASEIVRYHGGHVHERREGQRLAAVVVWLPSP